MYILRCFLGNASAAPLIYEGVEEDSHLEVEWKGRLGPSWRSADRVAVLILLWELQAQISEA